MATAIYFNGRRLNIPQAVSKVDASGLAATSPAAVGIVALVGLAEGGAPLTVREDQADATTPTKVQSRFRSGDLRTAGLFAFEPSLDPAVPGGAQKEILVKVNPSTQSGVSLPDGNAVDALDITSKDYGLFTNQVNVEVLPGTTQGLKYIVIFEDTVETFDDVGGEAIFDALYDPDTNGYGTMVASISASAFIAAATKAQAGLGAERDSDVTVAGTVLRVTSSDIGDTTQSITVYGYDSGGLAVSETLALNGTTPVIGAQVFYSVLGAELDAATAGTITVEQPVGPVTLFTFAPAVLSRGLYYMTNAPAAGAATVSIDVDTAVDVLVIGTNAVGAPAMERFDLTTGATTPVVGTTVFGSLTKLALGDPAAARTITVAIDAAKTLHSEFTTVAKLVDRLNALAGFTANTVVTNPTTFRMVDADYHAAPTRPAPSILSASASFYADLYFGALTLTQQSQFVNGARAPGGMLPPEVTGGQVFLAGGSEGVPLISHWQAALKLLEKRRYNTLVVLSRDPAVHNLAAVHLLAKCGRLKSEANGYVGIGQADGSGETRAQIQSQIQALNTRHLSAISQELERFDPLTGEATFYPPYIFAAVAAGMQAGSAVAEPLTRKLILGTDIRNDPSWNIEDDASDLIDRGLMMAEKVDGVGIRWIRSITTHLADDNLAFTEMSSNESLNTFVFEFRTALDKKIGGRGLGGTVAAITSLAHGVAQRLVDEEKIVAFRALQVDQVGDVFPVSVEVALVNPVNFIPITVHLTPTTAQAAA